MMRPAYNKVLAFVCALLLVVVVQAQEAKRIEYFFDSDPGYGEATPLMAVTGENSYNIPVDGLPVGAHLLCLRAQDDKGVWSSVFTRTIYVMSNKPTAFARLEYFLDSDPGYGEALNVEAPAEGEKTYTLPFDGISAGAHVLAMRGQDNKGNWSSLWSRLFYVYSLPGITQVEYYIDSDPGIGAATQVQLVPSRAQAYELTFDVNIDTVSIGEHQLCVRAKDAFGHWSTVSIDPFTVTEADGISEVSWNQPIAANYVAGVCHLTRDVEASGDCRVQVLSINGTVVATARWSAGAATLDIPVSATGGVILLVDVTNQENGLRTVKRVLVK